MKICLSFLLAERCYEELFYLCRWKKVQHVYVCMKDWREKSVFPTDRRFNCFFLNAECCHHSNRQQFRCAKTVCEGVLLQCITFLILLNACHVSQEHTLTHLVNRNQWCCMFTGYISSLSLSLSLTHTWQCAFTSNPCICYSLCVCVCGCSVCVLLRMDSCQVKRDSAWQHQF